MDDYLAKPVRAAKLLATMERVVSGAAGFPDPATHLTGADQAMAGEPGLLDAAALLAGCGGDVELLQKMCQHFQTFVPSRLAEASEALRDGDIPRLREAAHKLGGMVSSFSATAAEAAALLGRLASEGRIEDARQIHSRLIEIVIRITSVLDTLSIEQLRRQQENAPEIPGKV
jgi:HPt (histidine-containing phosphotransfer) domain-containing protein